MGLFGSSKKNKTSADAGSGDALGNVTLDDGQSYSIANRVDCLGDSCPRPQLMTKKAVGAAAPQDVIEVLVDNPTSMEALPPMCGALTATHLGTQSGDKCWHVYIQKNA